jgi:spore maturation protein CgeB
VPTTPFQPDNAVYEPPLRVAFVVHSLESDWNNGNAHFLRGVASELLARGHQVRVFEPADGWSRANLLKWHGYAALADFHRAYPTLSSTLYSCPDAADERARAGFAEAGTAHGLETACTTTPALETNSSLAPDQGVAGGGAAFGLEESSYEVTLNAAAVLNEPAPDSEAGNKGVTLDLEAMLSDVDLVLVHEWNDPALVSRIGKARQDGGSFILFLHDTHHRAVTDPEAMARFDLSGYDGVLAFGRVLRDLYIARGWAARAWIWHEGADTRVFRPPPAEEERTGLVWIGNWGDEERTSELEEFLLRPVHALGVPATAYGVRYPGAGQAALAAAGIKYAGWLANFAVPAVFARHAVTVHIPRRPYARALPGIPTIRVFEALACGIPLVSAPWDDVEQLFSPGDDYLVARDGKEMAEHLAEIMADRDYAADLAARGLATIRARHTCAHRVDELLAIYEEARGGG